MKKGLVAIIVASASPLSLFGKNCKRRMAASMARDSPVLTRQYSVHNLHVVFILNFLLTTLYLRLSNTNFSPFSQPLSFPFPSLTPSHPFFAISLAVECAIQSMASVSNFKAWACTMTDSIISMRTKMDLDNVPNYDYSYAK